MSARRRFSSFFLPALACALLSACAGSECACRSAPEEVFARGPDDGALVAAMQKLMAQTGAPASSRFEYVRVDLDDDGMRDALVLMDAPYGTWCDLYGCTLFVMKAEGESFAYVSEVRPVRVPFTVSETRTNGWADLVVRIDGRWSRTHEVALRFDGKSYPPAPEGLEPLPEYTLAALRGQKVFP